MFCHKNCVSARSFCSSFFFSFDFHFSNKLVYIREFCLGGGENTRTTRIQYICKTLCVLHTKRECHTHIRACVKKRFTRIIFHADEVKCGKNTKRIHTHSYTITRPYTHFAGAPIAIFSLAFRLASDARIYIRRFRMCA